MRTQPITYKGLSFYPDRHNQEFTIKEVVVLLKAAGFTEIDASFLKSRRHRAGIEKLRKSIIAFARKP